jgi:ABC-type amino acid transport system permease subunit
VVNTMVAQAEFNDARREGLLVISIIYFVISYVMSYVSRRIEESGSGSARRI